ncbi:MAG: aryl-sulfate sulfotransferase [Halanaerobiaceae bacterium]
MSRIKENGNSGVVYLDENRCDPSFRLYNSRNEERAFLIDIKGKVIHQWEYPQGKSWHYSDIMSNGNLIAIVKDYMILELDRESNLVWNCETRAHHDFARLRNGNTLVLSRSKNTNENIWAGKEVSYDYISEKTPDNKEVWKWEIEDHVEELAEMVDLIYPNEFEFNDWPHINTIEVLPENCSGSKNNSFKKGNLLMCGRHINTIWTVDRSSGEIVWTWGTDELLGPHMPTMLSSGNILIYDNGDHTDQLSRSYTRILELDPIREEIVWEYKEDPPEEFFSPRRGSNQRLPNGNTLISESDSGRLFEVTPDGDIVWEFINPDHMEGNPAPIYRVMGYPKEEINFK